MSRMRMSLISLQRSKKTFFHKSIGLHRPIFFVHTEIELFSHTDLTDLTDFNLPCGMIILTQRRRERRGLAENYYCPKHHENYLYLKLKNQKINGITENISVISVISV